MHESTHNAFLEIESPDAARRQRAALELEQIGSPSALAALALAKFRGEIECGTAEMLVADLQSANAYVRRMAADFLASFLWNDPEAKRIATAPLVGALNDGDRGVQISAAFALGVFGGEDAVMGLVNALNASKDDGMKVVLIKALGSSRDKALAATLLELCDHGASQCVRVAAQKALIRIQGTTY